MLLSGWIWRYQTPSKDNSVSMPPKNYAFIDGQNLNLGIKSQGFEVDYRNYQRRWRFSLFD
jgi:hypothetical protein